jgi:hypothetical protein
MSIFRVIKISPHSTGYKQIEMIDETIFSATKAEQQTCSFSMVLPEAESKNYKEGDMLEVILKPAGSR